MKKMTDDQLRQVLENEIQQSVAWSSDTIRDDQIRNLQYYLGMPLGNEVEGRSQVVSWDVFEIIESAMPGFIEPFFSGDNIGEFEPKGIEDEKFAGQATDYVNHIIKDQNEGFILFNTWIKDALLSKVGVVRAEWVPHEGKREEFEGLSQEQLVLLYQDPNSEIIEATAREDGLFDITVVQKKPGCVEIENIRPENFVVSRNTGNARKARVIGDFVTYTRSELKELGFKNYLDVKTFDTATNWGSEVIDAIRDDGPAVDVENDQTDPALEEVRLFRGFIRADYNGDGIAEYRRVLVGGGEDPFLENEEAEWHNYAVLTPIPIPHRVVGMGYADPAAEIQKVKTALTRQYLDSLYLSNRPRTYVNMAAGVSLDDLLNDRIGGIVRGTRPANEAIQPLVTNIVSRDALEGLQFADTMRETRLGITRYNQGLDAESLNKTATGIQKIFNAADKRQAMTLRIMAETGIKDLFRLVLRLICKYQDMASVARLRNEWVQFDPRSWNPEMDVSISVGIGSGDKTETLMMLQQFLGYMQFAGPFGCVTPQNVYEFGLMLAKNAKLKGADQKLITDPSKQPPPPPPPTPEQIRAQTQIQLAQFQAQQDQLKFQAEAQIKEREAQMQAQVDTHRQEMEAAQKDREINLQAELERFKAEKMAELELFKAQLKSETDLQAAQIKAAADRESAQAQMQQRSEAEAPKHQELVQMLAELRDLTTRPKRLIRGKDGKAAGARPAGDDEVIYDAKGRVIGLKD